MNKWTYSSLLLRWFQLDITVITASYVLLNYSGVILDKRLLLLSACLTTLAIMMLHLPRSLDRYKMSLNLIPFLQLFATCSLKLPRMPSSLCLCHWFPLSSQSAPNSVALPCSQRVLRTPTVVFELSSKGSFLYQPFVTLPRSLLDLSR